MRKLLAALTIVVCMCFTSATPAAGVKAPKELCLELNGSANSVYCLAVKSLGSVKFADKQKLQHYTISGTYGMSDTHYPIGGTGYMDNNFFRFHISGQYQFGNAVHRSAEGYINLAIEPAVGSVTEVYSSSGAPVTQYTSTLLKVPCSFVYAPDDF